MFYACVCVVCVYVRVGLGLLSFSYRLVQSGRFGGVSVFVRVVVLYLRRNYFCCVCFICDELYKDNFFLSIKFCFSGFFGFFDKFGKALCALVFFRGFSREGNERVCVQFVLRVLCFKFQDFGDRVSFGKGLVGFLVLFFIYIGYGCVLRVIRYLWFIKFCFLEAFFGREVNFGNGSLVLVFFVLFEDVIDF